MSKTAEQLREQAKKLNAQAKVLNEQANLLEQKEVLRLGNLIGRHIEADFKGFSIEGFKAEISGVNKTNKEGVK